MRTAELSLMQRCAAHIASETDIKEAWMLGGKALQCVLDGNNGKWHLLKDCPPILYGGVYFRILRGSRKREKKGTKRNDMQ